MGVKIYQQKQEMATKEESKENLDTADLTHMVNRIKEKTNLTSTETLASGMFFGIKSNLCQRFFFSRR